MGGFLSTSLGHSTGCDLKTEISSSPKTSNAIISKIKVLLINWKRLSPIIGGNEVVVWA